MDEEDYKRDIRIAKREIEGYRDLYNEATQVLEEIRVMTGCKFDHPKEIVLSVSHLQKQLQIAEAKSTEIEVALKEQIRKLEYRYSCAESDHMDSFNKVCQQRYEATVRMQKAEAIAGANLIELISNLTKE